MSETEQVVIIIGSLAVAVACLIAVVRMKPAPKPEPIPDVCAMCKGSGVWRGRTGMGRMTVEPCLCGLGVPR